MKIPNYWETDGLWKIEEGDIDSQKRNESKKEFSPLKFFLFPIPGFPFPLVGV
jgi:hypothetical protein